MGRGLQEDQAEARGAHHRFGAAACAELAEQGVDVELDGVLADVEPQGDGLVGQSLSQQAQDV